MNTGATPLFMGAQEGHEAVVKSLIAAGADLNKASNRISDTPLIVAASNGRTAVVKSLIDAGCDLNHRNHAGGTALSLSVASRDTVIGKMLVRAGAVDTLKVHSAIMQAFKALIAVDQFVEAAAEGDVARMEWLHAGGVNVNRADANDWTAMQKAAFRGQLEAARWLNAAGADVNLARANGCSPLFLACENGQEEMARFLLGASAVINQAAINGATAVYIGAENGHDALVKSLIAAGADLNKANNNGATPLYIGAEKGRDAVVKSLIAAGADFNKIYNNGATPLWIGAQNGHGVLAKSLIVAGADLNKANSSGATPLWIGAQNGHDVLVNSLIVAGADLNKANNNGTALFASIESKNFNVARLLVDAGCDLNIRNRQGFTALSVAATVDPAIAKLLIDAGAEDSFNVMGATTDRLVQAAQLGVLETVEQTILTIFDVDAPNDRDWNALQVAAYANQLDIVRALLDGDNKADVNYVRQTGETALSIACQAGNEAVVRALIAHGADLNLTDFRGMTPLYFCAEDGDDKLAGILVDAGADVNVERPNGATALTIASQRYHSKVIKMLLAANANPDCGFPAYEAALSGQHNDKQLHTLRLLADYSKRNKWRVSLSVLMALLSVVVAFIQLFCLPFLLDIQWSISFKLPIDIAQFILFQWIFLGLPATATMWLAIALVDLLLVTVAISMLAPCHARDSPHNYFFTDALRPRRGVHVLDFMCFFLANLGFIALVTQLLRIFACTRHDDGTYTLDASNGREPCFTGEHISLMTIAVPTLIFFVVWSVRLLGSDGWFSGIQYWTHDPDAAARGEGSGFDVRSWFGRLFGWGDDRSQLRPHDWHGLTTSPWLPMRITIVMLVLEILLISITVFFYTQPLFQLIASLVVSLLLAVLVVVFPHRFLSRTASVLYGASFFVLLADWVLALYVYLDNARENYTTVTPGGDDGAVFTVHGPLKFWLFCVLCASAGVAGALCTLLATRYIANPARVKQAAAEAAEEAEAEVKEEGRSGTATAATLAALSTAPLSSDTMMEEAMLASPRSPRAPMLSPRSRAATTMTPTAATMTTTAASTTTAATTSSSPMTVADMAAASASPLNAVDGGSGGGQRRSRHSSRRLSSKSTQSALGSAHGGVLSYASAERAASPPTSPRRRQESRRAFSPPRSPRHRR